MSLFPHYLKVAARNMRRYPLQMVISVVGLAAGFVCLSLSAIWIHYENTFNNTIPDVDRVYKVGACDNKGSDNYVIFDEYYQHLLELPELEVVTSMSLMAFVTENQHESGYANKPQMYDCHIIDSAFTAIFPFEVVSGSLDIIREKDTEACIVTESFAREQFGNEYPIGQTFKDTRVAAVVKDLDPHSSICAPLFKYQPQSFHSWVFVKLHEGVDVHAVEQKLNELPGGPESIDHYALLPLRGAYDMTASFATDSNLTYSHVKTFRLASICLVLCAFAGYLVLYLNRTRGRRREMALRSVHGASPLQNVTLFATETLLVFAGAILLGLLGIYALAEPFAMYADVVIADGLLLGQSLLCMAVCMAVCLALCLLSTAIVCRRPLQQSLQSGTRAGRLFQRLSIAIQLIISIALAFCVTVMLLQFRHQRTTDWGHNAYGVMFFSNPYAPEFDCHYWESRLAALPMVDDVSIEANGGMTESGWYITLSTDPACDTTYFRMRTPTDPADPHWHLTVLDGALPTADEWQRDQIALTASAAKDLGLEHPVGQTLYHNAETPVTVVAVVKDIVTAQGNQPAIVKPDRFAFDGEKYSRKKLVVFFPPSQRKALSEAVQALMKEEEERTGQTIDYMMDFMADGYEDALRRDRNMARLLGIVTGVDLFLSLFGIFSIVTLACRQRRKEIAIRKVYGVKIGEIIALFVREYGIILLVSAAVAFVAGTLIMDRWLQNFIMRMPLSWWLYVLTLVAAALLIALCVGSRILRTACENPADVVKSE